MGAGGARTRKPHSPAAAAGCIALAIDAAPPRGRVRRDLGRRCRLARRRELRRHRGHVGWRPPKKLRAYLLTRRRTAGNKPGQRADERELAGRAGRGCWVCANFRARLRRKAPNAERGAKSSKFCVSFCPRRAHNLCAFLRTPRCPRARLSRLSLIKTPPCNRLRAKSAPLTPRRCRAEGPPPQRLC